MKLALSLVASLVALAAAPALSAAQSVVNVTLSPDGEQLATELGVSGPELANRIRTNIDEAYGTANVPAFLQSFADATSFSSRGLGVDYASNPSGGVIGVGVNVAGAASDGFDRNDENPVGGVAANLAIMAGVNLSGMGHPGITLYGNGFYRKGTLNELSGSIMSVGGHIQIKLLDKTGVGSASVLRWSGIDLIGGVEMTRWKLDLEHPFSTDIAVDGQGNTSADLEVTANGNFHLGSTNMTVPIELTTGFRVALLVAFYVGAGADIQMGNADTNLNLTGEIHTKDGARNIGTATAAVSDEHGPTQLAPRALAGVQLNLWKLKVFVQGNVSPIPAASLGFGVRLVL